MFDGDIINIVCSQKSKEKPSLTEPTTVRWCEATQTKNRLHLQGVGMGMMLMCLFGVSHCSATATGHVRGKSCSTP